MLDTGRNSVNITASPLQWAGMIKYQRGVIQTQIWRRFSK